MSRIGKLPVVLSDKTEATINANDVKIKGPIGELSFSYADCVEVTKEENTLIVKPVNDSAKALWGTTRSILSNMVEGVVNGYKKSLEIV